MQSGAIPITDKRGIISHFTRRTAAAPEAAILQEGKPINRSLLGFLLQADLANDVDEISSLEGQLVWLIGRAVPQTLVVVSVIFGPG